MNSRRATGVAFSGIGFALAVVVGLLLALAIANGEIDAGQLVVLAILAFIPVALLVGAGIYLYVKSAPPVTDVESTMQKQRDLLDMLKTQRQVNLSKVAQEFDVDAAKLHEIVHELMALRVISGYVDWERGLINLADDVVLRAATTCAKCGNPIRLDSSPTSCQTCGMEYFLA